MTERDGTPSPLFADSDRAVADGVGRSIGQSSNKSYGLGKSVRDFPIKKIAFRKAAARGVHDDEEGGDDGVPRDDSPGSKYEKGAAEQQELERIKHDAREAGLQACSLAAMGIVPGAIYEGEDCATMSPIKGSFGWNLTEEAWGRTAKRKAKAKIGKKEKNEAKSEAKADAHSDDHVDDIVGEDGDDTIISAPAQTVATTLPTEAETDNASHASKTSSFDPKRIFSPSRGKKKKGGEKDPRDMALKEARELLASGAWMCGVCGTPFDTSENAKEHEKVCLIEWARHDKLARQAWKDKGVPENNTQVPMQFLPSMDPLRDYPEYLPPRSKGEIPLSSDLVRQFLLMTDQALASVANRSSFIFHEQVHKDLCELSLKKQRARENAGSADEYTKLDGRMQVDLFRWECEYDAMKELELACRDRHYYARLEQRAMERRYGVQSNLTHHDYYYHRLNRIRAAGSEEFNMPPPSEDAKEVEEEKKRKFRLKSKAFGEVKGRFDHAYKLVKEGPSLNADGVDDKSRARKDDKEGTSNKGGEMRRDLNTLYINVVVKNSVQVVNNELQRIAQKWWQTELHKDDKSDKEEILDFQFEWIRAHTQKKVIQLAGIALASDFTPGKVAVQLSLDLYRLMGPQLKPRGVDIETAIEFRDGQYFVLAVNVLDIDWITLMRWVTFAYSKNTSLALGQSRGKLSPQSKKKKTTEGLRARAKRAIAGLRSRFPSRNEVIVYVLYTMYHQVHAAVSVPILRLCYYLFLRYAMNKFILNAVTDDIFRYVEEKGMEMQLGIKNNSDQASFMLAALREVRGGIKEGAAEDGEVTEDVKPIIGPLMGPAVKEDGSDAKPPPGFSPPDVLEFIGLETDLPVGFLRLRWALLSSSSSFLRDAFFVDVMKYDKVEMGQWSANGGEIGLPKPPDGTDEGSFLNATLEYSYLMPKSAFVKANMCYATLEIVQYDSYCLVIKEKTLTPEVPYGNTFIAWTQYSLVNTGKNTCRLVCSVEAEFPNGQPMVARQIKSGMRSGTAEKFMSLGETICRYADAFPQ